MRIVLHAVIMISLALGVAACGNKGKLKTPSQIEAEEAKKAQKQKKAEQEKAVPPSQTPPPEQP